MKTMKLKYLFVACLACTSVMAQTSKVKELIAVDPGVTLKIDAQHTQVVVEHWDKNEIMVEAFLEMPEADKKDVEAALDNWKIDITEGAQVVSIRSSGGLINFLPLDSLPIMPPMPPLPEMMAPLQQMIGPLLQSIQVPPLPPQIMENMGNLRFDFEAYREGGEKYLQEWEAKVDENMGEDVEKAMEEWAAAFQKDSARWKRMESDMEAWGEKFGKRMEAWGEDFEKKMSAWSEDMETKMTGHQGLQKLSPIGNPSVQRTLYVRIPKEASLDLNARHGKVTLKDATKNLRGTISHGALSANSISGKETDLKVAYAEVNVNKWEYGQLTASFVRDLRIEEVKSIKINANSSDVSIGKVNDIGIFRGNFGELTIEELGKEFRSVDIFLENSDLRLDLPEVSYNFRYSGNKSQVDYPRELDLRSTITYDNHKLEGFNKEKETGASISIQANFSTIHLD